MLYVGDPTWDVGERTISGAPDHLAERLREFGDMGVSHLQVRFRSRDGDKLACQRSASGEFRCQFGFDLITGKSIGGSIC